VSAGRKNSRANAAHDDRVMPAPPVSWRGFGLMFLDGLAGLVPRGWRHVEITFAPNETGALAVAQLEHAGGGDDTLAQAVLDADGFRALLANAAAEWLSYEPDWDRRVEATRAVSGGIELKLGETAITVAAEDDRSRTWSDPVL